MKKTRLLLKKAITVLLVLIMFSQCKEEDKYPAPEWLGGTNIETLQKAGNFTIFLSLMEKAGYTQNVTKQLNTLFVPNDEAFQKYFLKKGINSINDLSYDEAFELFMLHIIPQPLNANHLVYEKAWNRLESRTEEYRSLFFRKKTQCFSVPYNEVPKYFKKYKGQELLIYSGEKYVPLFSKLFFQDYNGIDSVDYPFLYPEHQWSGLIHWANAKILSPIGKENSTNIEDLANATANGFIYYLDEVVDRTPNIEEYIKKNLDKYSIFYDMLQRFASYAPSPVTDKFLRKFYTKSYINIPSDIARESGPSTDDAESKLMPFTLFLPDNTVLQNYLNNTIYKTYDSIEKVPDVTIQYIIQTQITKRLELKSKFTKNFFNFYGDNFVIDAADVEPLQMCSNGMVYGSKKVMEPNVFKCVPGELFFNKNYTVFLTMLNNTNSIATLSGKNDVTVFAPSNDQIFAANIRMTLNSKDQITFEQRRNETEQWKDLSAIEVATFVQDHIYLGRIDDIATDSYIEMNSHNYIHIANNSVAAGLNKTMANIESSQVKSNGLLHFIDQPILARRRMGELIFKSPDMAKFAGIMAVTKILDTAFTESGTKYVYPNIALTEKNLEYYWSVFVPDNNAIDKAILDGKIPDYTKLDPKSANYKLQLDSLQKFVNYHFIRKTVFDDGVYNGIEKTLLSGGSLTIINNKNELKIIDGSGQEVVVKHENANYLVRRGVVHKITSVLLNN